MQSNRHFPLKTCQFIQSIILVILIQCILIGSVDIADDQNKTAKQLLCVVRGDIVNGM